MGEHLISEMVQCLGGPAAHLVSRSISGLFESSAVVFRTTRGRSAVVSKTTLKLFEVVFETTAKGTQNYRKSSDQKPEYHEEK